MSNIRRRGLVAAMNQVSLENLEEQEQQINDTQANIDPEVGEPNPEQEETVVLEFPEAMDSPEADEVEVEKAEAEVVSVEEAIDEGIDVIQQVETIADIVERGNENGGLNQTGAELLTATLESLYDRVGIAKTHGEQFVPSLESFGGTGSRIRAGNIALEDMKEKAKKIWETIRKAISVLIEKLVAFYNWVFDLAKRYKSRVAKLNELVEKAPDAAKISSFEDANIAQAMSIGGKVSSDIPGELNKIAAFGSSAFVKTANAVIDAADVFNDAIRNFKDVGTEMIDQTVEKTVKDMFDGIDNSAFKAVANEYHETAPMLGNVRYRITVPQSKDDIRKVRLTLEKGESEVSPKLNPLDKGQMTAVIASCDKLLDTLINAKDIEKSRATRKKLLEASKTIESMKFSDEGAASKLRSAIISVNNLIDALPRVYRKQTLSTVAASFKYVEKSIRARVEQKEGEVPTLAE